MRSIKELRRKLLKIMIPAVIGLWLGTMLVPTVWEVARRHWLALLFLGIGLLVFGIKKTK